MNFDKIERHPGDVALNVTSALKLNGARQLHSTLASNANWLQDARKHAARLDGSSSVFGSLKKQISINDISLTLLNEHPDSDNEIRDLMLQELPPELAVKTRWMKRKWNKAFVKPIKDTGLAVFLGSLWNRVLQRNLYAVELAEQCVRHYTQQSQENYSEFCSQLGGSVFALPTAPFQALDNHSQLVPGANSGSGSVPGFGAESRSRLSAAEKIKADYYQHHRELEQQQQQQQMHAQGYDSQDDIVAQSDDEMQVLGYGRSHNIDHGFGHGFGQAQGYILVLCQGFGYVNEQGHSEGPVQSYGHGQQAYGHGCTSDYNQHQIRHADVYDQGQAAAGSHGQVSNYLQVPQHSRISQHLQVQRHNQVSHHLQALEHGQVLYHGQALRHSYGTQDNYPSDMLSMYASTGYYQATGGHQLVTASAVDTRRTSEQPATSAMIPSVVSAGINASANHGRPLRRRNGIRVSRLPARLLKKRLTDCHQGSGGQQPAATNVSYARHVQHRPVATAMASSLAFSNMNAYSTVLGVDEVVTTNDLLGINDDVIARIQSWQASVPLHPPLQTAPPIPSRPLPSIVHANASTTTIRVLTPVEHLSVDQETIKHHDHISDSRKPSKNQPSISNGPTTLQGTNVPRAGTSMTPIAYPEQRASAFISNTTNLVECQSGAQNSTPKSSCQAGPNAEAIHDINQSGASNIQASVLPSIRVDLIDLSERASASSLSNTSALIAPRVRLPPRQFATVERNEYDSEDESWLCTRIYQHTDSGESFDDPELLRVSTRHERQQINENGSSSSSSSGLSVLHRQEIRNLSPDSSLGRHPAYSRLRVMNPDPLTPSMGASIPENGSHQSLASETAVIDTDNEQAYQVRSQVPMLITAPIIHQSGSSLSTNAFTSTTGSVLLHHQQPQAKPNVHGTMNRSLQINGAHTPHTVCDPIHSTMYAATNTDPNLPLLSQSHHHLQVPQECHAGTSSYREVTNCGLHGIEYDTLNTAWYGLDPKFVLGHHYSDVMCSDEYGAASTASQLQISALVRTQAPLFDGLGGAGDMSDMLEILRQGRSRVNRIQLEEQAAHERAISYVDFPDSRAQPLPIAHDQCFRPVAVNLPQIPPRTSSLSATVNQVQQVDQRFGPADMNPPPIPPRTSSLLATVSHLQQIDQERSIPYINSSDLCVRPLHPDHLQRFEFAPMNPLQLLPRVQLRGVNSPMDKGRVLTAMSNTPLEIVTTQPTQCAQNGAMHGINSMTLSTNPQVPMSQASDQYQSGDALKLPSWPPTEDDFSDEYSFGEDAEVPEDQDNPEKNDDEEEEKSEKDDGKDKNDSEDGGDEDGEDDDNSDEDGDSDDEYGNGDDHEEGDDGTENRTDEDYGYQGDSERDDDEGVVRGPDLDGNLPLMLPLPIDHFPSTRLPVPGRSWHEEPNYYQRWYEGRSQRVNDWSVEDNHVDINNNNVDTADDSKAELDDVSVHGDDAFEAFSLARKYQTSGAELVFSGRIGGLVQRPDICEVDRLDLRQAIEDAGLPSTNQGGRSPLEESSGFRE
ncbi:hypothetical protein BGZ50_001798 [Haplosporangium sp. Z 11]|nr:hypothetical protein BGZ50_001798 [Haplosporangium sp. Z 11]